MSVKVAQVRMVLPSVLSSRLPSHLKRGCFRFSCGWDPERAGAAAVAEVAGFRADVSREFLLDSKLIGNVYLSVGCFLSHGETGALRELLPWVIGARDRKSTRLNS